MASAKRKSNGSLKNFATRTCLHPACESCRGVHAQVLASHISRRRTLSGEAKPVEIMSERFTLYRGESGTPYVVGFRCPHRGTQLSAGWVEGDCIRCVYHGWLFDGSGQCIEQPAEEKSFASKIRIRNCPTREYLGLIFAYFGEGNAPPFPLYHHMAKHGVLEVLSTEVWPWNFFQRIDNNGDTYHVPFVHRDAYSASPANNRNGLPEISKEESPWGTTSYASFSAGWQTLSYFSCPTPTPFATHRPNRSVHGKTACNGMFPSTTSTPWEFRLRRLPLIGEAAGAYQARHAASIVEPKISVAQMGDAVLSGKLRFRDLDSFFKDKISLVHSQDYVAQVGQGALADRRTGTSWPLRHGRHSFP